MLARCAIGFVLASAIVVVPRAARADDALALAWHAPDGCPRVENVRARALELLSESTPKQTLVADATVSRADPGYRAEVDMALAGQPSERRVVTGESCQAVSEAVELMLAIAIDPSAGLGETPPADAPAPAPRTTALTIAASGLADAGGYGGVAGGAELAAGIAHRRLALEIAGAWIAPRRATVDGRSSEGASAWIGDVSARGCVMLVTGAVEAGPCGGVGVEWIVANGFGAADSHQGVATVVAPAAGLRVRVPLGATFALRAALEANVPLARPSFVIDNTGTVEKLGAVSGRAAIGAEARF
ncbi:MAG TPA: hypothetical protein VIF62_35575 [Labilithrix sp.]|jgi:hypothetical protein